ncbi:MAG: hypothetical protein H0X37_26005 [Herpetosiphonaceae bacterium]|nr:hypothetical protein [Herpetosiphonaceae bacterium]
MSMIVVLTTRVDPDVPLAHWHAHSELLEIRERQTVAGRFALGRSDWQEPLLDLLDAGSTIELIETAAGF